MQKFLKQFFPRHKWWSFTLIGVIFFVSLHVGVFYWHGYLVKRYDTLYNQVTTEGALVDTPEDFQKAHASAQKRNILTRPDILAHESNILQIGIRALTTQYESAIRALRDSVTGDITSLRAVVTESQEYLFPQRDDIAKLATTFETELNSGKYVRVNTLKQLSLASHAAVKTAQSDLDAVQRQIVLQDITGMSHEMAFIDSVYRLTIGNKLKYDYKTSKKNFAQTFTKELLDSGTTAELLAAKKTFSESLDPYRVESQKMRAAAKIKRAAMVEKEMKKWTDTQPPVAPLGDVYMQIFISLKQQTMYVYQDGELVLSTPITSGRTTHQTIRGTFHIYTKERDHLMKSPFPEEDYELWVDYWMPFSGGYGIHDSCNSKNCWRTRFGGQDYHYGGSHGCINTPYNVVKFLFGWAPIGTTVHIE